MSVSFASLYYCSGVRFPSLMLEYIIEEQWEETFSDSAVAEQKVRNSTLY